MIHFFDYFTRFFLLACLNFWQSLLFLFFLRLFLLNKTLGARFNIGKLKVVRSVSDMTVRGSCILLLQFKLLNVICNSIIVMILFLLLYFFSLVRILIIYFCGLSKLQFLFDNNRIVVFENLISRFNFIVIENSVLVFSHVAIRVNKFRRSVVPFFWVATQMNQITYWMKSICMMVMMPMSTFRHSQET